MVSTLDGAVAQLVERLHGMQEVVGSIPIGSTTLFYPLFGFGYMGVLHPSQLCRAKKYTLLFILRFNFIIPCAQGVERWFMFSGFGH